MIIFFFFNFAVEERNGNESMQLSHTRTTVKYIRSRGKKMMTVHVWGSLCQIKKINLTMFMRH